MDISPIRDLARQHLPATMAERWLELLRPGIVLSLAGPDEEPAAWIGGTPRLPPGTDWPEWKPYGPLTFLASLDCGALPVASLDVPLPRNGTLLFFFHDYGTDRADAPPPDPGDATTWPQARVLHLPHGTEAAERAAPGEVVTAPAVPLSARLVPTSPVSDHWSVLETFGARHIPWDFEDSIGEDATLWTGNHIGGHTPSIQGSVEAEMPGDPRDWTLLASFHDPSRGQLLYFMIRHQDLAEGRLGRAWLHRQN
ncbi:YwqG family protein [Streptomyces sp. NPDC047108]|uniref:YwqG family protein n=1 Tax=Streptomyces sp. NPDC047108 TaxID=3155025 RepID=UPI0033F61959